MSDIPVKTRAVASEAAEMLRVLQRIKARGGDRSEGAAALVIFLVSYAKAEGLFVEALLEFLAKNIEQNWSALSDDFDSFIARKRGLS
jgi:hypothetical protein